MDGYAISRKGSNRTPHTYFAYFLGEQVAKNAFDDSNLFYMPILIGSESIRTSGSIDFEKNVIK